MTTFQQNRIAPTLVAGVDTGTLSSPSYIAWLGDREFIFDLYRPTIDCPLPAAPSGQQVVCML